MDTQTCTYQAVHGRHCATSVAPCDILHHLLLCFASESAPVLSGDPFIPRLGVSAHRVYQLCARYQRRCPTSVVNPVEVWVKVLVHKVAGVHRRPQTAENLPVSSAHYWKRRKARKRLVVPPGAPKERVAIQAKAGLDGEEGMVDQSEWIGVRNC